VTIHAFIDESARGRTYLITVTVSAPHELGPVRRELKGLLLPGEREIHFKKTKNPRRRTLADRMSSMPVTAHVYMTDYTSKTEEDARQRCLDRTVRDLVVAGARRIVLDSRQWHRDVHDKGTLQRALGERPSKTELTYEHMESPMEPILWVSDAVGWCYGAGGAWKTRIGPIIERVVEL
jgi:hypothetical protein